MTDQEGNVYRTIVIGIQELMAENLKTSIYSNGNSIENVTNGTQWGGLTTGAWCNYNNNSQFDCPYGKLYNWFAVADPRNVCPTGWHVPSDDEWNVLIGNLDPTINPIAIGPQSTSAGGKMKSVGTQFWISPNGAATNESAFSGLPGGYRYSLGTFNNFGFIGEWWTSTELDSSFAHMRDLNYSNGNLTRNKSYKYYGLSVRCFRD